MNTTASLVTRYRSALLLSIFAAAVLYAGSMLMGDFERITTALADLTFSGWLIILSLSLANYLLRYWRWQDYITTLSGRQLPHTYHLNCYLAGFALTTTPGKAGEAARSLYLKQQGISWNHSLSAFFVERLLDLLAILLLGIAALYSFPQYNWIGYTTAGILIIALWALHSGMVSHLLDRLGKLDQAKIANLAQHLNNLLGSSARLLRPGILSRGMIIGVISWGCEGIGLWWILQELGSPISLPLAAGIYGIGILAGALSFIPGGLGSTEAIMALMLMAAGVDSASAVAATLICRIATLWFAVVIGLGCMSWMTRPEQQKVIS